MSWPAPNATVGMVYEGCCNCGTIFAMTEDLNKRLRNNHETFFCPSGHRQSYTGESAAEKWKRIAELSESKRAFAEKSSAASNRRASAARGQVTKIKNRVKNGVCLFCNRTFDDLARHMHSKHEGG